MRLLLDTHILLWWLGGDDELGRDAKVAIDDTAESVTVSAATVWEIAIKRALGRLESPEDLLAQLRDNDIRRLAVTDEHAVAAGALPLHHRDPFDRMLVAQAQAEGLTLMTRDPVIFRYSVAVLAA